MSESEDRERRLDAAKSLLTFWNSHYWDSSRLLAQGWAFYLTIIAALVGFVATRPLANRTATGLLWAAMLITAAHITGAMLWSWGILKLVKPLEALNCELDASLFDDLELREVFARWRMVGVLLNVLIFVIGMVILAGLILLCKTIGR
jgi:hypothetical protein